MVRGAGVTNLLEAPLAVHHEAHKFLPADEAVAVAVTLLQYGGEELYRDARGARHRQQLGVH